MKIIFKTIIMIFIAIFAIESIGCASTQYDVKGIDKLSPCQDSLFLILKTKNINSLTTQELNYMNEKQRECESYCQLNEMAQSTQSISNISSSMWGIFEITMSLFVIATLEVTKAH